MRLVALLALTRPGVLGGAVLVTVLAGCDSRSAREVLHPTKDNLPPKGSPQIVSDGLPSGLAEGAMNDWLEVRDMLQSAPTVLRLGKLTGDVGDDRDPEVFAFIHDVEIDSDDNIYILDSENYQVRVFDRTGVYRTGFGSPGDGPEEFLAPNGLELLSDGRLIVSDRGNEFKIFTASESGFRRTATIRVPMVPEAMCSAGDHVFASGWDRDNETIIHQISVAREGTNRHFGRSYEADNWLVRSQLSDGPIACLADPLRVVFGFSLFPVVRAYQISSSELMWTAQMEDFAQMTITQHRHSEDRSSVAFDREGVTENMLVAHGISPAHVLLQTVRVEASGEAGGEALPGDPVILTYLVDAASGQGALVSDSLPLVMAVDPNRYVAVWVTPFPRLELRVADNGG